MKKFKVTAEWLNYHDACGHGIEFFKKHFPGGLILSDDQGFNLRLLPSIPLGTDELFETYAGYITEFLLTGTGKLLPDYDITGNAPASCGVECCGTVDVYTTFAVGIEGKLVLLADAVGIHLATFPQDEL